MLRFNGWEKPTLQSLGHQQVSFLSHSFLHWDPLDLKSLPWDNDKSHNELQVKFAILGLLFHREFRCRRSWFGDSVIGKTLMLWLTNFDSSFKSRQKTSLLRWLPGAIYHLKKACSHQKAIGLKRGEPRNDNTKRDKQVKILSSISLEKLKMKYRLLDNGRKPSDADRKWY